MPNRPAHRQVACRDLPNDHGPAHVHVLGPQGEAVFKLHCPAGPPTLRESMGFALQDINRIGAALRKALSALCNHWEQIHGNH